MIRRRDEDLEPGGQGARRPAGDADPIAADDAPTDEAGAGRRPSAGRGRSTAPDTGVVGEAEDITPGVRPGQTSG